MIKNNLKISLLEQEIINLIKCGNKTEEILLILSITKYNLIKEYYRILNDLNRCLDPKLYNILLNEYLNNYVFLEFLTTKTVLISDTHFGSKSENLCYFEQVKDFLKEHNDIKYLIHAGDIGDGMVNYDTKYATYNKQIDHILEIGAQKLGVKQFYLGGNHDRRYKDKIGDILSLLESVNNEIIGIGYYQSYIKIADKIISLEHNSYYNNQFVKKDLSILGHAHNLAFKNDSVILPTLSDDFLGKKIVTEPGFVVLESKKQKNHLTLCFTDYKTTVNGIEKGVVKTYKLKH